MSLFRRKKAHIDTQLTASRKVSSKKYVVTRVPSSRLPDPDPKLSNTLEARAMRKLKALNEFGKLHRSWLQLDNRITPRTKFFEVATKSPSSVTEEEIELIDGYITATAELAADTSASNGVLKMPKPFKEKGRDSPHTKIDM